MSYECRCTLFRDGIGDAWRRNTLLAVLLSNGTIQIHFLLSGLMLPVLYNFDMEEDMRDAEYIESVAIHIRG